MRAAYHKREFPDLCAVGTEGISSYPMQGSAGMYAS